MATWLRETTALLEKEFRVEWKQKYAMNGLFLYAIVMVFIVSLAIGNQMEPEFWNLLFWILMLFISVNAVARSFMAESKGQMLYQFNLAGPSAVFFSKLIYNFLVLLAAGFVTAFFCQFFNPQEIRQPGLYFFGVFLGAIGFSSNLTLVSSITSSAGNKSTLFAVLSFPLTLPLMLSLIRITKNAMEGENWSDSSPDLIFTATFIVIISSVSFILFPSLWRE